MKEKTRKTRNKDADIPQIVPKTKLELSNIIVLYWCAPP